MIRWAKIQAIATFEFLATVKRPGYLITTFGMPLFMGIYAGVVALPAYYAQKNDAELAVWGVIDEPNLLALHGDAEPSADVALFLEGDEAVARREGEELVFAPAEDGWRTSGDPSLLDYPDALARSWAALHNPNAGEVIVSAAPGYEFADLGGRHHAGGGSHGSLEAGDSVVPMLTIGLDRLPESIVEVAPAVLRHFGVEPPAYASSRRAARAA